MTRTILDCNQTVLIFTRIRQYCEVSMSMSITEQIWQHKNFKSGSRSGVNLADTGNFSQFFGPLKQGYMQKVSFFHVVHGWNKVMLGSMELHKELFRW